MSALTQEQFDQLPEFIQGDYVSTEQGFQHGGFVKLKGSLNDIDGKYKTIEGELNGFKATQQEAIDKASKEAYEKAIAEGNVGEIEARYKQQIADVEKRAGESEAKYQGRLDTLNAKQRDAVSTELSDIATDSGKLAFKALVASLITIDADGKEIYLNTDGSASSLSKAGFIEDLKKNPMFMPLIKAELTTEGGGNVNGNNGGSAAGKALSRDNFEKLNNNERMAFFKAGGKIN